MPTLEQAVMLDVKPTSPASEADLAARLERLRQPYESWSDRILYIHNFASFARCRVHLGTVHIQGPELSDKQLGRLLTDAIPITCRLDYRVEGEPSEPCECGFGGPSGATA